MPKKKNHKPLNKIAIGIAGIVLLSLLLAAVSNNFSNVNGTISFIAVLAFCAGLAWLAWGSLRIEQPPAWLLWLTLGAALLRLALGLAWFIALPAGGYDTDVQNAGYVMEDAFNRDRAAWDLAQARQPLISAFQGASSTDQYGGLLFLSALIYRYLSPADHLPLLVIAVAATASGLAVAFTWAFSRRLWGDRVANLAAWGLALYPEAALLGSSQMREAFTVLLVAMAVLGMLRLDKKQPGWSLLAISLSAAAFFSWPFVFSLLLLMALAFGVQQRWRFLRDKRVWAGAAIILIAGIAFVLTRESSQLWIVQSARWQAYVSANASGWVARQFERMPLWAQVPSLMVYGIIRPLLPAALAAGGPPVWSVIGIWRALGWTVVLALLLYASYLALRSRAWKEWPGALLLASWVVSFTASYRGGGDLWDNPRYRSAFAAVQITLAAWAWAEHKKSRDPWLRRTFISLLLIIFWLIPWYLRRYTAFTWPIVELYQVFGLGLVSFGLYLIWDWIGAQK
jgi:hypothetical protein